MENNSSIISLKIVPDKEYRIYKPKKIQTHRASPRCLGQSVAPSGVVDGRGPYAATGNIRSFDLVLPERLEYLSFGADPDPDNNGILTDTPLGLVTDNGDVIYYKLRGDGKRVVKLQDSIHIREGELVDGRWLSRYVDGLGQSSAPTKECTCCKNFS